MNLQTAFRLGRVSNLPTIWSNVLAGAVLACGSLLVSPYLYDYDLALLAVPIALVAWDGYRRGWQAGEREVLVLAWVTPLFVSGLAEHTGIPLAPLCLILVFAMIARRGFRAGPGQKKEGLGDAT